MQHEKIKKNLIGVSRNELEAELIEMGEKTFRTKQLWHWIYHKGETDFSKMTSLGKSLGVESFTALTVEDFRKIFSFSVKEPGPTLIELLI